MLSEYERRELALIEQSLAEEDRRLADALRPRTMRARTPWLRRRWLSRTLLGFGLAMLVLGVLTAADGVFMQGVLFSGAALVWMRWQSRSTPATPGAARARPADGPPPGRHAA
jgi:hypothetical protein